MDFVKMEGLGNDFVVVDGPMSPTAEQVRIWCDRRRGIGADGVLVATPVDERLVRMEYWNADGSPSEMCGNGLRCVARYAFDQGWVEGKAFTVETAVGPHPVVVLDDGSVRALLGRPGPPGTPIEVSGHSIVPADMGNPHAVIIVEDTDAAPVSTLGPVVEVDEAFPNRTNVEFLEIRSRDRIRVRTWERGVGETLACGTGAGAAAVVAHAKSAVDSEVQVELLGGVLQVEIRPGEAWMTGPAEYVFLGTI